MNTAAFTDHMVIFFFPQWSLADTEILRSSPNSPPFLGIDKFMKTGLLNLQELQINSDWGKLIAAQVGIFVK